MAPRSIPLVVCLVLLSIAPPAFPKGGDWDPDDATFDPEVTSVIANGATRLGDPSPFRQDGIDIVGYTHVGPQQGADGKAVVSFALMVPLLPGETAPRGGGALYLPPADAERLASALRGAADQVAEGSAKDGKPLETFVGFSGEKEWTLTTEGQELVLRHVNGGKESVYRFAPNPARKLAGALDHTIGELRKKE